MSLFDRLISTEHPESPQLLTVALAAVALPGSLVAIVAVCCRGIAKHNDLGSGACWALGAAIIGLGILAGFAAQVKNIGLAGLIAGGTSGGSVETPTASAEPTRGATSGGEGSDPGCKSQEGAC